jgi:hypothetical protein
VCREPETTAGLPGRIVSDLTVQIGQFLAVAVHAQDTRRPVEARRLQVPQVLVHGLAPWAGRPQDTSAAAYQARGHPTRWQRDLVLRMSVSVWRNLGIGLHDSQSRRSRGLRHVRLDPDGG